MEERSFKLWRAEFLVLALVQISSATLSLTGIKYEGQFTLYLSSAAPGENSIFLDTSCAE